MYLALSEAYAYGYIMQKAQQCNVVESLHFNKEPSVAVLPSTYGSCCNIQDDAKYAPTDIETCVV
jgi:hypothetical protein